VPGGAALEQCPSRYGRPNPSPGVSGYQRLAAREFRYDTGRARCLWRDVESNDNDGDGIAREPTDSSH
jgi:hypothetical protein